MAPADIIFDHQIALFRTLQSPVIILETRPEQNQSDDAPAHERSGFSAEVEQTIRRIVRFKLRVADAEAEDHCQDVRLQLLERMRAAPDLTLNDLRNLAATIAWRVCARQVREQNPQFHALRNRIQYLLTRQAGLACWREADRPVAGFAVWQGKRAVLSSGRLPSLLADRQFCWRAGQLTEPHELVELLTAIFNQAAAPIGLNELVSAVADLLQIQATQAVSLDADESGMELASQDADVSLQVEKRLFLRRMWEEVQLLPPHQRAALLLNLRDEEGRGCIALFLVTGIASLRQLAAAVALPDERFAVLWNDLPLDDQTIAELIGLTRQQIINARKSARERLARRLRGFA